MEITHKYISPHDDGPNDGRVQPSNWNEAHEIGPFLRAIIGLSPAPMSVPYIDENGSGAQSLLSALALALFRKSSAVDWLDMLGAAALDSPTLIGMPIAPTPPTGTNTNQIATMAAIRNAIDALLDSAPGSLDTLNELAAALGDDPNFATTVAAALAMRLRFDVAQSLTSGQKSQGQANLGLAAVAGSGAYTDLTGRPTLGTAAALNAGTAINNLVPLVAAGKLPALDGSLLTGVPITGLRRYLSGFKMSTAGGSSSFSVAAGTAHDDANTLLMQLSGAITKNTAAFVAGSGNGALDTGAIAANTWYHVHAISAGSGLGADIAISLNPSSTALAGTYPYSRRIGSLLTDASKNFVKFVQDGDDFMWDAPVNDVSAANPGTASVTRTLTVPIGVRVKALMTVTASATAGSVSNLIAVRVSDLLLTDRPASLVTATLEAYLTTAADKAFGGQVACYTNTSGQVRTSVQNSDASSSLVILTNGWVDRRGQDG